MDELAAAHRGDIGRELIMRCVDVGRVAIVVGVPWQRHRCPRRVIDARFRREWRMLGEDTEGDEPEHDKRKTMQTHDGRRQAAVALQPLNVEPYSTATSVIADTQVI